MAQEVVCPVGTVAVALPAYQGSAVALHTALMSPDLQLARPNALLLRYAQQPNCLEIYPHPTSVRCVMTSKSAVEEARCLAQVC